MANIFYVKDIDGNLVPAKFLEINGAYVSDPNGSRPRNNEIFDINGNPVSNANPRGWLIVPAGFDIQSSIDFANSVKRELQFNPSTQDIEQAGEIRAMGMMTGAFWTGGTQDLQRI